MRGHGIQCGLPAHKLSLSLSLFPELAQRLKLLNSIDETHHKAFIEREVGLG